jgi:hypothetical protein
MFLARLSRFGGRAFSLPSIAARAAQAGGSCAARLVYFISCIYKVNHPHVPNPRLAFLPSSVFINVSCIFEKMIQNALTFAPQVVSYR